MRLPDRLRTTQRLGDLLIETPVGWIPARQIADIRETEGPNQILRENGRRRAVVLANSDGAADMAQIVGAIRRELAASKLPAGFFTRLEGTFQAQEEASRTIGALSMLSLTMIFAILYSRYRSALLALIIMGNVPLALIGSVAALWIAGAAAFGRLDDRLHHADRHRRAQRHPEDQPLHQSGPARRHAFGRELVMRGSLERLTPVLMTALAAGVALVPLLIDPTARARKSSTRSRSRSSAA